MSYEYYGVLLRDREIVSRTSCTNKNTLISRDKITPDQMEDLANVSLVIWENRFSDKFYLITII